MKILALGTNIEPREYYLKNALEKLEENGIVIKKCSKVYSTPAWGGVASEDFLNLVVEIDYKYDAYSLLDTCQKIELELGRERKEHWGDRTIDIDIIEFDEQTFNDERLIVPHKYLHERNFVLLPLYEIVGDVKIAERSIVESLKKINDKIEVYKDKL